MFHIEIVESPKQIGEKAFEVIKEVLESSDAPVLGLATGSSPIPLYQAMIEDFKTSGRTYSHVTTFNLDEYVGISQSHSQSYHTFMKEQLFNHIDIDLNKVNLPNGSSADQQAECDRYEKLLSDVSVDVQVLGIGSNGHIGFNEPGTPFTSTTHVITLKEQTRQDNARFFASIEDVPTQAITMGIASIMKAKKILLIASTSYKAKAIAAMIHGPITEECPASILQTHPDVTVILDKEAARELANG